MKKVLTLLAISATVLPAIAVAAIDTNLKYGARGAEVSELQEFLIGEGFLSSEATGNFYSLTLKAVVAYQATVGLPTTGFVGPMTRDAINRELAGDASTQAEIAETGTSTPPLTESPVDLLKKQVALLMQQIQTLQQQAATQNQILQNQQAQQEAQNRQAQQTQQQLGQIVTNTTPPATPSPVPTPAPTPVPAKPVWNVVIEPYLHAGSVKARANAREGLGPDGLGFTPVFTVNTGLVNPMLTMDVQTNEHGLSFDYLMINGVRLEKKSQNVTLQGSKYATSTYHYAYPANRTIELNSGGQIILGGLVYESYPYPDYTVTLTLSGVSNQWTCTNEYESCSFPTLPITNTVVVDPR